jgi:hypothetical protein
MVDDLERHVVFVQIEAREIEVIQDSGLRELNNIN